MLGLARPAVAYERRVLPLLLEGVGAQFLELVPTPRRRLLEMHVLGHSGPGFKRADSGWASAVSLDDAASRRT